MQQHRQIEDFTKEEGLFALNIYIFWWPSCFLNMNVLGGGGWRIRYSGPLESANGHMYLVVWRRN